MCKTINRNNSSSDECLGITSNRTERREVAFQTNTVAVLCHVTTYPAYCAFYTGLFFYCDQYHLTCLCFISGNRRFKHHCRGLWKATAKPQAGHAVAGRGLNSYAQNSSSRIYKTVLNEPYAAVFSCRTTQK
jgi:hypothetical protein